MNRAEQIFYNGRFHTLDDDNHSVAAIAVTGGRIVARGSEQEMAALAGDAATRVNMNGHTVIPAFLDPHGHFPESGLCDLYRVNLCAPPLGDCHALEDVFARLQEKCRHTPAGEFVFGVLFDHLRMREQRFPTRAELDAISAHHPIWVMHMSFHAGAGNSSALAFAGIDKNTPQPEGGFIEKDSAGEPTGLLEEPAAMGKIAAAMFGETGARFRRALLLATDEYYAQGTTTAHNAWASSHLLQEFAAADKDGELMRLVALPDAGLEPALSRGETAIPPATCDNYRLGPRKLFSDGSIQVNTAYLSRPYHTTSAARGSDYRGYPVYAPEKLRDHVLRLHAAGHQIHIHANGDAAADDVLAAMEYALNRHPRDDHRHTIIHGQTLREDQLERMRTLGVSVSFFSYHAYVWGDQHRDIFLGPERAMRLNPAQSAAKKNIRFTIHNDVPVTPMRPFHLIWSAVNRLTATGKILGEEQRLTTLQALRAHTIDAAWQVFWENDIGSLEVGKKADFAVLSDDPLTAPVEHLRDITVEKTFCEGRVVYTR